MATEIPEPRWERQTENKKLEITKELFSADVPWGLYNVVPESMRSALPMIDPRWMGYREETVAKKANPSDRDENFRLAFWTEYNTAKDLNRPLSIQRVMAGVCSPYYYKYNILSKPRLLAYIVYPPTDYMSFMKNMLYKGQQRMKEIMSVSAITKETVIGKNGKKKEKSVIDIKLANMQLKTFALLDNRVKGAIVQRVKVEQKNLNVNVSAEQVEASLPKSVIDIDKELLKIDRELARNQDLMKNKGDLRDGTYKIAAKDISLAIGDDPKDKN